MMVARRTSQHEVKAPTTWATVELPAMCTVIFAIILVYGQTLHYSFLHWDDYVLILTNPLIFEHTPATFRLLFTTFDPELYIPLTLLSFRMEHLLFGFRPEVFHFTNVALHTLVSISVLLLAWQWSRRASVAFLCALLFAVHPLNAETVSWISIRKDILMALFFVAAILLFGMYRRSGSWLSYVLCLLAALLALLSKVTAVSLPLILLLLEYRMREKWTERRCLELCPFFLLSTLFSFIGIVGKLPRIAELSSISPTVLWPTSIGFFLTKAFLPTHLSAMYPFDSLMTARSTLLMFAVAVSAVVFVFFRWRRLQEASLGIAFYLITFVPALLTLSKGFGITLGDDRYMYLPLIGVLYAASYGLISILDYVRVKWGVAPRYVLFVLLLHIPLIFGIHAHEQSRIWKDPIVLQRSVAEDYPEVMKYQAQLGNILIERGRTEEALRLLERASGRAPENLEVRSMLALAYAHAHRPALASKTMDYVLGHPPYSPAILHALADWYAYQGNHTLSEQYRRSYYLQYSPFHDPHRLKYIDHIDELLKNAGVR